MQVELSMILDDRGMGYFSDDLDYSEADDEDDEDEDGNGEINVDTELEAGVKLRQHKRPDLLRTRWWIALILDP